ncbi:MAG: xanthine dehydrogenase family protein molybdopterin-binding subunit [Gemmatimonadetes bacterium]|nr:xanthine dehydrogenase family protein molybdopterin-binding subunit [Gemmatimonadota bacterium]
MTATTFSRRDFVRIGVAAGGGLMVFGCGPSTGGAPAGPAGPFAPNPFIRLDPNGTVTVFAKHLEMGQGTYTGLATLIAEEMDADWSKIVVEGAPNDTEKYKNLAFGMMGTGGSSAIANSWEQHRKAGATARAVLLAAAAKQWGVSAGELTTEPGEVVHAKSNRRASYATLAGLAATLAAPAEVPLKDPKDFRYIGKPGQAQRPDAKPKSTGRATFTQDVKLDGLLTAVVAHPPLFGAKVKSFDAAKAKAVPGVTEVVQIPTGVAVLGINFWAAKNGRDALTVEWDTAEANTAGTAEIMAEFRELAGKPGREVRKVGDAEQALSGAAKTVEASYEFPFLAHACMEPMNCVVQLKPDSAELWYGAQFQTPDGGAIAAFTGLKPEQIRINMLYAGGSFGRRANGKSDFVMEAVTIAKAINGSAPVKLVWTREDDTASGYFRPAFLHRVRGGLDGSGNPVAWSHRVVGPSITAGTPLDSPDGNDQAVHEGVSDHPYDVPNIFVDVHQPKSGVPVQWWRSVGHTHTAFAVEMFVDEMARAAGKDPLEFRRALLGKDPRRLAVLNLAAEKAGWGTPLPAGRARGIAVHKSFATYVAEVAEVSLVGGKPKVHRVVCAVDCGIAVNPDVIAAQMESGIAYGLGAALYGQIAVERGKVVSTNFDKYRVLRMAEMPAVEVHIMPSTEQPTGVGEPGLPPIGPAVANALVALTGKPVRRAPLV